MTDLINELPLSWDKHIVIKDKRILEYLARTKQMFDRPRLDIEKTILIGLSVKERLRQQRHAFLKTDSLLPAIDLYAENGMFDMNLEEAVRHHVIDKDELYRIYRTYKRLQFEFDHPFIQNIIKDL